ncbi:hypothetical protein [Falsirhodobacter halotolerans]|uniref:hypothetical protein n=1 Tax=Falsirhodobacter halotolerans TaxID=1146892 RepID=UPI001FD036F2|nr:hypothetical protein [Falsirhodobacter halotolerans]MCJ8139407.1 hypothetical protein [Falsirhodobacter halotolerans]
MATIDEGAGRRISDQKRNAERLAKLSTASTTAMSNLATLSEFIGEMNLLPWQVTEGGAAVQKCSVVSVLPCKGFSKNSPSVGGGGTMPEPVRELTLTAHTLATAVLVLMHLLILRGFLPLFLRPDGTAVWHPAASYVRLSSTIGARAFSGQGIMKELFGETLIHGVKLAATDPGRMSTNILYLVLFVLVAR